MALDFVTPCQCGRKLGAHGPGLVHHGAEHVEQQGVNVIRGDHPPIVSPPLPASTLWRPTGRSGITMQASIAQPALVCLWVDAFLPVEGPASVAARMSGSGMARDRDVAAFGERAQRYDEAGSAICIIRSPTARRTLP